MRTSKNLSLVSYNSLDFLHTVLEKLVSDGIVENYWYVPHKADKGENKDHTHVYVFPAGTIDTETFKKAFNEFSADSDKPLGVVLKNKKTGKINTVDSVPDAYWYSIHDSGYLDKKQEERNIKDYPVESIVWSSPEFQQEVETVAAEFYEELQESFTGKTKDAQIYWALENGYTRYEIISRGYSAALVNQVASCRHYDQVDRNDSIYWQSRQADSERTYAHVVEVAKQEAEYKQAELEWNEVGN